MKNKFKLYVITCFRKKVSYEKMVSQACSSGADIIQLRAEELNDRQLLSIAIKLRKITRKYNVPLIINNRLDIALAVDADGIHLGQEDIPVPVARALLKKLGLDNFIIGKSTHSYKQVVRAVNEETDYISIGPIFATPTKPDYKPVGIDLLRKVKKEITKTVVAIGGIDKTNIKQVLDAGADIVAVVRAGCGTNDIRRAVKELKKRD